MASVGHVAVGLAAAQLHERWFSRREATFSRWPGVAVLRVGYVALSLLPDVDVVGFLLGVPYGAAFGHRGATHSLMFAIAAALVVALVLVRRRSSGGRIRTGTSATSNVAVPAVICGIGALVFCVVASHGLLDTLTDGGKGVALLWPFSLTRYFAPWRPIPVAPIGAHFFTPHGMTVAATEMIYFFPLFLFGLWPFRRPSPVAAKA